jgi:hypothetical protein
MTAAAAHRPLPEPGWRRLQGLKVKVTDQQPAAAVSGYQKAILWKPTDRKFGTELGRGWIRWQSGLKRRSIQLCLVSE